MTSSQWLLSGSWVTPLGDHVWQSTACLVLVWLATLGLRGSHAAVRHALWVAAFVKFLVPFALIVAAGRYVAAYVPASDVAPDVVHAIAIVGQPFSGDNLSRTLSLPAVPGTSSGMVLICLAVWALGCITCLLVWSAAWSRIARVAGQPAGLDDPILRERLRRLEQQMGIRRPVRLVLRDTTLEPGVLGIWRSVLIWPHSLTARLNVHEVDAILAHELCHVRRRDNLTSTLVALVKACFWFHPLLWWAETQLYREREHACDEGVVALGCARLVYAESILKACEFCLELPRTTVAGVTGSDLQRRIEGIMTSDGVPLRRCGGLLVSGMGVAAVAIPLAFGVVSAPRLRAQAPAVAGGSPAFAVASVKPNANPDGPRLFQALPGGRVNLVNQTVRELIFSAYQMQDYQVLGGPDWLRRERFDVVARAEGDASPPQMLQMVRTMLADRFGLVMHRETRVQPLYRLVMARGDGRTGPQLKPSACVPTAGGTAQAPSGAVPCGNRGGPGTILSGGITLDALANRLGRLPEIGRPVVNESGLTGSFDVELSFTPASPDGAAQDAVSIFTAVQEQLGLRLEPGRGPVDVFVIDRVERPSPD